MAIDDLTPEANDDVIEITPQRQVHVRYIYSVQIHWARSVTSDPGHSGIRIAERAVRLHNFNWNGQNSILSFPAKRRNFEISRQNFPMYMAYWYECQKN